MATFKSNTYDGRYLQLDVWQDGGYAKWALYSTGNSSSNYYTIYNVNIKINGTTVYNPGTVAWNSYAFPAKVGSTSGSVWIGNGASSKTITVYFTGYVFYNRTDNHGGNFTMSAYIFKPTLSAISYSSVKDTSVYASFSVSNNNGEAPSDSYIDASTSNFGTVASSISGKSGTLTGLTPNRTYYLRGNAANSAGRAYTAVTSFTTAFYAPGNPGAPVLTYDQSEPIPKANIKATWTAASAGSTAIGGYRIRLYKNGTEIQCIDTDSTAVTYTFGTFEALGFVPGDVATTSIFAYCYDWAGNKHWSGSGTTAVNGSNSVTVVSDKYIYVSQNGGGFTRYKMYTSQNGGSFVEVKKEKFKVI